MTRWAIVADLNRCVGCQTCTTACKHANATAPGVQWRKVLDFEVGTYPDVSRAFVPVGCMHCDDPPCLDVCPSTATRKRDDGIVTIDYDLCIGCSYCAVACPYQARSRVDRPRTAYFGMPMPQETLREDPKRLGVAQKCNYCSERIDFGLENGLTPGIDPDATPACVNSCIADALHFGDVEDPDSNVSTLLAENQNFRMHEDIGTGPGFYYLWERGGESDKPVDPAPMVAEPAGMANVSSKLQTSWDWRAAVNFIAGGTGTGLFAATALAGLFTPFLWPVATIALAFVATGLFFVWLEIGRPWRFLHVAFHAKRSWMTREAFAALPFFGFGAAGIFFDLPVLWLAAAAIGLVFLYCQGMILRAAKGIPAWRQAGIVPLIIATGLTEGAGLFAILATVSGSEISLPRIVLPVLVLLIAIRFLTWRHYRRALGLQGAPTQTFKALDRGLLTLAAPVQWLIAASLALSLAVPAFLFLGALLAVATGWAFKFTLITRAAFDQGFSVTRMPARGAGESAPGIKPGWTVS